MRYRKRSKRSYRRDCRKRYNKKTRQCRTRSRRSRTISRRSIYKMRNRRRGTMRGGYTIPKGIDIPNSTPLTIGQDANAEFSRNIYSPRLPPVEHIPVRQSENFFGQTGPVPNEKRVLYSKKMAGGNKKPISFYNYSNKTFVKDISDGKKLALKYQNFNDTNGVVIGT